MAGNWFLEGVASDGTLVRHDIGVWPFSVGRDVSNGLSIQAMGLSRRHAELSRGPQDKLVVTDLQSTNGTFVNGQRISGSAVVDRNDIIHFGNAEFRLGMDDALLEGTEDRNRTIIVPPARMSRNFVPQERQFRAFLAGEGIAVAVQPIVDARSARRVAYELLGRCTHPELPASPARLFGLAASLGSEAALSRAFRQYGLRATAELFRSTLLFVNIHPSETFEGGVLDELEEIRREGMATQIVVELHESAVLDIGRMHELAARLKALGIRFAYDDFGAGQARLNELGEVPPDFVKFDMGLVRGIDVASERKRKMLGELVQTVHNLGSIALAEGVETDGEAAVCRDMGFDLMQGYLIGRPVGMEDFRGLAADDS